MHIVVSIYEGLVERVGPFVEWVGQICWHSVLVEGLRLAVFKVEAEGELLIVGHLVYLFDFSIAYS